MKVDFSYIKDIAGGQKATYDLLLQIIVKNLDEYPGKLRVLWEAEEWQQLKEQAHKYKSSVAYLQIKRMGELLDQLEYSERYQIANSQLPAIIDEVETISQETKRQILQELEPS